MAEIFRPVKGAEHKIKAQTPRDGYVYFATDTQKIYLAEEGKYLPMGGNSGIYYGDRVITDEEKDSEITTFVFTSDEIEGEQTPNVDDLILNIPDGCFYRIIYVGDSGNVTGERLTIAGSGSSSGPGGTGSSAIAIIDTQTGSRYFVSGEKEMIISFRCNSTMTTDNKIESVQLRRGGKDLLPMPDTTGYAFGDVISINIAPYANELTTDGANTITAVVTDSYGTEAKKNFTCYLVDLGLSSDLGVIYKMVDGNQILYPCVPSGGAGLDNRYIRITVESTDNPGLYVVDKTFDVKSTGNTITIPIDVADTFSHGVYELKAAFCAKISADQTVSSPQISHQIIFYETSVNTPLIAAHVPSTKISQYDSTVVTYMIIDQQSSALGLSEVNVDLVKNGVASKEVAILGEANIWKETFNKEGIYDLEIHYNGQKEYLPQIIVSVYEGELPEIDETNIELFLSAEGRSNTQANKDSWSYGSIESKFENFLWGTANGWLDDGKGQTALKLTNGAKLSIPNYRPFGTEATIHGLTIELDFMFSGVLNYAQPLIHCLSKYTQGGSEVVQTGFHITGQKATLNSSVHKATTTAIGGEEDSEGKIDSDDMALQAFSQYYNENTRIHLTYVIERVPATATSDKYYFVYTYLNGVLSGIMRLDDGEIFEDINTSPAIMEFDSTYGDIYLYNIRVYRTALSSRTVINNYIADLTNIDEKMALYKSNNIFTDNGLINIKAIQDIAYQLSVPYVLLKGGSKMSKKFKDSFSYSAKPEYALPLTKTDYRAMSMQMFDRHKDNENPIIDIPLELEDTLGNKVTDFKDIKLNTNYKMKRGVQVYGQGTSSMIYPVKNLRLKFPLKSDFPVVYEGACPIEIACFKADYMDSSASHNTGTANLIYDLLSNMNMRSPAQAFQDKHAGKDGVAKYDLLTAIRGFPIVCFYTDGESDKYTFIGRYNFNIDKATPEPFGFFPQKVYTGETVTDDDGRERKVVDAVGLKVETVKGKTVLPLDAENKEIERDIIQCWEMLNNDTGSPTKFLTLDDYRKFGADGFRQSLITSNGKKYGWMNYYEDRYPDAMVGGAKHKLGDTTEDEYEYLDEDLENGIFRVACWLNSTATEEFTNAPIEPVYYVTRDSSYNSEKDYYEKVGNTFTKKEITISKIATVKKGADLNASYPNKLGASIDTDVFAAKVGNVVDQYVFIYSTDVPEKIGWMLGQTYIGADLTSYGITYTGGPVNTNTLIAELAETNTWEPTLYEKYTTDSADYRLAKFRAEFTQYFDLKFALFYYVLTMVLLMMDSRAKNMMLASWDQKIWYPIFYDMDTLMGLNNTGFNKFAYDTEDDPADKVFNGFDSVLWNNMRECFYNNICEFYAQLRPYLTDAKLLSAYNANASDKWNEALTTADAEYKYTRPYEEGYYDGKNTDPITGEPSKVPPGGVSYLYAAQGKRTNHRAFWATNRTKYFDSKYTPLTLDPSTGVSVDNFNFRAYSLPEQKSNSKTDACVAQVPASHQFDITALNNSYQSIYIGNILYGPKYAPANGTVTLGPTQVKHEVESYVLNPGLISNLGDLSDKYLGTFNFPSTPTRLTELNFGRSSRSHKDKGYDKYYNNLLNDLNISTSCPYLQKLNVARCTGLRSLLLSDCTRLQSLDAEGTKLTLIKFPKDSILRELYLPNTLTSLELINQPHLTTIEFDSLAIGAASIRSITLDKVSALDSYPIVKNMFKTDVAARSYLLTQVNWNLTEEDDFILEGNEIKAIDILDKLADEASPLADNIAQALSGTLTINIDKTVDQFAIYNKYNRKFPNLKILYGDSTTVIPAKTITFFNHDVEELADEFYLVYTDGTETLAYLTSAEGPNSAPLGRPTKASTEKNSYEFTGRWKHEDTLYTTNASEIADGSYPSLYNLKPESDMDFYPEFAEVERKYTIKCYDWDDSLAYNDELPYGASLAGIINYRYRDSSDLEAHERWAFQGWSLNDYGDTTPVEPQYLDTANMTVTGNLIAYAHYIKEDARVVPTKEEYFKFTSRSFSLRGKAYSGYEVSVNPTYAADLAGKVTIPRTYSGSPIISVGEFSGAKKITHVFFADAENSECVRVANKAFSTGNSSEMTGSQLQAVYLPNSIIQIGERSFMHLSKLTEVTMGTNLAEIKDNAFESAVNLVQNELPNSLEDIGHSAFFDVGAGLKITKLPASLQYIRGYAFYTKTRETSNVMISDFGGSLKEIHAYAFAFAGANITTDTIFIRDNVEVIQNNAFGGIIGTTTYVYGGNKIKQVYIEKPEGFKGYPMNAVDMGFIHDDIVVVWNSLNN